MTKITADHLARGAVVYIRQSTADQLLHNPESRRRQYGLADHARQLGWTTVEVIDDDLGRSGGGIARPGFERLLATICEGRVGAVLAIEASRLARNGRDWHTLIEFCGLVGTIIVDEDGIYDPRHPNDRLLLGMKGTMSELELSLFRQRSHEALKQKARRGALFLGVAAGYVRIGHDRIDKDPDRRVQDALKHTVATRGGCTNIPRSTGRGSGARDHSLPRLFRPCRGSGRAPGSVRADQAPGMGICGDLHAQAAFKTAPSITTPLVAYFQRATSSLRASATMVVLRIRPPLRWTRS